MSAALPGRIAGAGLAPGVLAGEHRVSGGGAGRCRRVGVGEPETFAGKAVDVRRLQAPCVPIRRDVAVAQVVGVDEDDVRRAALCVGEHGSRRVEASGHPREKPRVPADTVSAPMLDFIVVSGGLAACPPQATVRVSPRMRRARLSCTIWTALFCAAFVGSPVAPAWLAAGPPAERAAHHGRRSQQRPGHATAIRWSRRPNLDRLAARGRPIRPRVHPVSAVQSEPCVAPDGSAAGHHSRATNCRPISGRCCRTW